MINRKAFFEIFFYNRENPSREMMETAENVWRAYMRKYGLGLDAGNDGQPTYEEVREITYLANAAVEMMAAREAAAAAPPPAPVYEPEEVEEEAPQEEEEIPEPAEEAPAENEEEPTEPEPVMEEAAEEPAAPAAEEAAEEPQPIMEEVPAEKVLPQIRPQQIVREKVLPPVKPVYTPSVSCDIDIWVEQLIHWCEGKGFQCIRTVDEGDCYLHVYLPHKKEVIPVGKWCLKADTNIADLAAEISKLYAYCNGFADCFERLMK